MTWARAASVVMLSLLALAVGHPSARAEETSGGDGVPWWAWTLTGGGAVALAGGGLLWSQGQDHYQALADVINDRDSDRTVMAMTQVEAQDHQDSGHAQVLWGTALMAAGATAAAVGLVTTIVTWPRSPETRLYPVERAPVIQPIVTHDTLGLSATLRF